MISRPLFRGKCIRDILRFRHSTLMPRSNIHFVGNKAKTVDMEFNLLNASRKVFSRLFQLCFVIEVSFMCSSRKDIKAICTDC